MAGRVRSSGLLRAVLLLFLAGGCGKAEPVGCNVVLILIDTLRADHCSAYGYFRKTTPHLEKMARAGTLYEQAWSQAPWTCPSMVSLFTGRYVMANYKIIPGDLRTLPERFQARGYSTGALVGNPLLCQGTGFERGFDFFEVADKVNDVTNMPAAELMHKAEYMLNKKLTAPFFAWFHLFDPHDPYKPPPRMRAVATGVTPGATVKDYRGRQPDNGEPIDLDSMMALESIIADYDGEVAYADRAVGKILDVLKKKGILENTLVVVTSDHGEGLFAHAVYPESGNPPDHGLYCGHGEQAYEEALHVPLVIRGPGFAKGVRSKGLVEVMDLYPTLLAAAGLDEDGQAQGMDLGQLDDRGKSAVFAFGTRDHAVRTRAGLKLIHPVLAVGEKGRHAVVHLMAEDHPHREPRFFDLARDPLERHNLAVEESHTMEALKKNLEAWQVRHRDSLSDTGPVPEEMQQRLRGLGYVR